MSNLNKLAELDLAIGESLEQANYAAKLIREIDELDTKQNLLDIGHTIASLWEVRQRIYNLSPELKPDFVREFESNENLFNELTEIHAKALEHEEQNEFIKAKELYKTLLSKSKIGHYKRLAEAGLFRVTPK